MRSSASQDVLGRVGVAQPHIALRQDAEVGTADDGDAGIFEQRRRQRLGLPARALDVGECVERALRGRATDARQAVQALDHDFAPAVELRDHPRHLVLRTLQRGKPGILRRRVDAGMQVDRELARIVVELAGPNRVAQPPAGHGIGLRPAIEQDQPVADRRIGEQAHVGLAVIDHVVVDLVRHHRHIGKAVETGDELVDLALWRDAAGRIGRRVHDQQPGLRRDQLQSLLRGEGKAVLLADRYRDRPCAGIFDHGAIDREIRDRDRGCRHPAHRTSGST